MAFFLRHGSGIVCAPMSDERANQLELPFMVDQNTESHGTAFTVSVDHRSVGTGISAADRAATVRAPGRSRNTRYRPAAARARVPVAARPGGMLKRTGHTEAATDLVTMAGMAGVGVITGLVGDNGVPLPGGPDPCVRRRARPAVPAHRGPCPGAPVRRPPGDLHRGPCSRWPAWSSPVHSYTSVLDGSSISR